MECKTILRGIVSLILKFHYNTYKNLRQKWQYIIYFLCLLLTQSANRAATKENLENRFENTNPLPYYSFLLYFYYLIKTV